MRAPHALVSRLERAEGMDAVVRPLTAAVSRAVRPRAVRDALSGAKLGHPLHPVLTDVPIGAWSMSVLLDAVGGRGRASAADLLLGVGLVAAVPTAAAGLNDWADTTGADARVGLVHAAFNVGALSMFGASMAARRRGRRSGGKTLSAVGLGLVSMGGYLGGHLAFGRGINVNRTAFENRPQIWRDVLTDKDLAEGEIRKASAGSAPVLLTRREGKVLAMSSTCSHLGGPLDKGALVDGCIVCPWHGSTFRLTDGSVVRGPASSPQPTYDVRVADGRIQVCAR